jgi:hypothetical protein
MTDRPAAHEASPGFTELLGRALTDGPFREQLFADPASAAKEYKLTEGDRAALENLDRETLDKQAGELGDRKASSTTIAVGVRVKF